MNRESLKASDFSYDLPEDRIAKYPLPNRNLSKLLTYKNGKIEEDVFANLADHLPPNSVLVFNDTKVLSARMQFQKDTGAKIEVFCLEPYESTVEQALTATQSCRWQCMVGNLKRFKPTDVLQLKIANTLLSCRMVERQDQYVIVEFEWEGGIEFSNILDEVGQIPLPPYLNREAEESDEESYQTVYAKTQGAVAAPTAGLHFVPEQLEQLKATGHQLVYLTLYVGAGTFRQVKADRLVDHDMHSERIVVSKEALQQLSAANGSIIPVGTTSLRSLESLYWLAAKLQAESGIWNLESGAKLVQQNRAVTLSDLPAGRQGVEEIGGGAKSERSTSVFGLDLHLNQNDAYELNGEMDRKEAFECLLSRLDSRLQTLDSKIDFHSALFIMPGYEFKVIDGLITNFHQPQSTLLSLVSALIGEDWQKVYQYALENDFRFLSYGDSSLLLP